MNKKQLRNFMILDVIEIILAVIGLLLFTFIFAVVDTNQRYLFLICDLYVAYVFLRNWDSIEKYFKQNKVEKVLIKDKITELDKEISF